MFQIPYFEYHNELETTCLYVGKCSSLEYLFVGEYSGDYLFKHCLCYSMIGKGYMDVSGVRVLAHVSYSPAWRCVCMYINMKICL